MGFLDFLSGKGENNILEKVRREKNLRCENCGSKDIGSTLPFIGLNILSSDNDWQIQAIASSPGSVFSDRLAGGSFKFDLRSYSVLCASSETIKYQHPNFFMTDKPLHMTPLQKIRIS